MVVSYKNVKRLISGSYSIYSCLTHFHLIFVVDLWYKFSIPGYHTLLAVG